MTIIKRCVCKHGYQDRIYGKGLRLFNFATKPKELGGNEGWRCTVCGRTTAKIKGE